MADQDEREEELSSITAIFPELAINPADPFTASIDLPVAPLSPLAIAFPAHDGAPTGTLPTPPTSDNEGSKHKGGSGRSGAREVHRLSYLPPLKLQIALPEGYPAEKPPRFTISATANWVPEYVLMYLEGQGDVLWEEYGRGQVVFAYIDFLQQAAEKCFDLVDSGGRDTDVLEMPAELKIELLDFDIQAKRRKFEQETFDCGVCLEPKKGSACYRLMRCGHVFCVGCLQDFYNNCIAEGDVASVRCIDPSCGKDGDAGKKRDRTLNPSELLQIPIEKSVVQRYAELKRKKKIESDKDTIYCPRSWCQGFARSSKHPKITDLTQVPDSDSESDAEDGGAGGGKSKDEQEVKERASRLTICEKCDYAFCRVCLAGWHGEYVRCYPRNAKELSEEEQASYNWLRRHTSPCPTCQSPCQKTHGCNHMVCFQCRTHFCYLCSHWLEPENPYQHFNTEGAPCYMRLWELEEGDEAEGHGRAVFAGGVRGWEADVVAEDEAAARELQAEEDAAAAAAAIQQQHPPPQRRNRNPNQAHLHFGNGNQRRAAGPRQQRQNQQRQNQQQQQQQQQQGGRRAPVGEAIGMRGEAQGHGVQDADAGLQRFLRMVVADEEDGWDSDELDGEEGAWVIPVRE
ncbi:RING finger protein [Phyllosticta citricarpa]